MAQIRYRQASVEDAPAMARAREAAGWEGGAPQDRIVDYLTGAHDPREALAPRIVLVATAGEEVVGYAAGHLTRRLGCEGEVEWLFVAPAFRRQGVAERLLRELAGWFREHGARKVCVDAAGDNLVARRFYARHGAGPLGPHWLAWTDFPASFAPPAPREHPEPFKP